MKRLCLDAKSIDLKFTGKILSLGIPAVGDLLAVFNYPEVIRYRVIRHEENCRRFLGSPQEAIELILEPVEVSVRSIRTERSIGIDPAKDLVVRLEQIGKLARSYIHEKRHLRICHADFLALCQGSGLSADLSRYHSLAFRGTPMTVGDEAEEWNVSTCFEGVNDDDSILYVTLPGGLPFVMDPILLDITKQIVVGGLAEDGAVAAIARHAQTKRYSVSDRLLRAIRNTVQLTMDGIMPPYDAAQDLVKTLASAPGYREAEVLTAIKSKDLAGVTTDQGDRHANA